MRKIYIVTRIVTDSEFGTPVPNLGVHTSRKSAEDHYFGVVEDRKKLGDKVVWERLNNIDKYNKDLREAYIERGKKEVEKLKIEVWEVKK